MRTGVPRHCVAFFVGSGDGKISRVVFVRMYIYRAKDERQANVQLPLSAVEHMQALVKRSGVDGGSRVMDVGAGTGILLRFLQGAGVEQVCESVPGTFVRYSSA